MTASVANPLRRALAIQGWMSERELAFLYATALSMPPGARCVEIGSWKGRSTVAICEGLRAVEGATLTAVDTFRGDAQNELMHLWYGEDLAADEVYRSFREQTAGYDFLKVRRVMSAEASREIEDASLDWVFIDAEHTFEHVLDDLERWLPKVKPGGLVSGHDYGHPGVKLAVRARVRVDGVWESIWYSRRRDSISRVNPVPLALGRTHAALCRVPAVNRILGRVAPRYAARADQ